MRQSDEILSYDKQMPPLKRRQLAAFYTPLTIAEKMATDAIHTFLKVNGIGGNFIKEQPKRALKLLQNATFLDMSCGTGVFVYAYLSCIEQMFRDVAIEFNLADFTVHMIVNDIDEHALKQLRPLLKSAFNIEFLGTILAVDALLQLSEAPSVQRVLNNGGFDIIMSNPPYFGEKGHTEIFQALKKHEIHQVNYQGKMDYYYFFVHLGIDWLANNGVMSCVTTDYFKTADSAKRLRRAIQTKTKVAVLRPDVGRFEDAKSIRVLAYTLTKSVQVLMANVIENKQMYELTQSQLFDDQGNMVIYSPADHQMMNQIQRRANLVLGDIMSVNQGLVSGADKVTRRVQKIIPEAKLGEPIFVFEQIVLDSDAHLKPLIKNSDIGAYTLKRKPSKTILYSNATALKSNAKWLKHLEKYRPALERRREVKKGTIPWYALQWSREQQIFEKPKLIAPQRAEKNTFSYVEAPLYGSADIYYLTVKDNVNYFGAEDEAYLDSKIILKSMCMYLNSPLVYYWLYLAGKKKAKLLELYATPLKHIPVINLTRLDLFFLAEKFDLYESTLDKTHIDQANQYINDRSGLKKVEINRIFDIFNKNKNDE